MQRYTKSRRAGTVAMLLGAALLVACGGGQAPQTDAAPVMRAPSTATSGRSITNIKVVETGGISQEHVPLTFGQVFAVGDLPQGSSLQGILSDGSLIPLQVDAKASNADGSVRHAVITAILPQLMSGQTQTIGLLPTGPVASPGALLAPSNLLQRGFTASVNLTIGGQVYSASVDKWLQGANIQTWLSGPLVNEWMVSAPLTTAAGVVHPQLSARFAVRSYAQTDRARVDVVIENDWAYQPAPQNYVYDAQVLVGGQVVYSQAALTHYNHARWRKTFWWGVAPQAHVVHNTAYLIASKALPNYDQRIAISQPALAALAAKFTGARAQPMGPGVAEPYMPTTGGRPDIGLLPGWAAAYLVSMDARAKTATLGTADLAGSWSAHYRDQKTDRPISLKDFPYMTVLGNPGDTYNPVTHQREAFPVCGGDCSNPNHPDAAHTPAFSYLPYLVTGDYYHLEELQFWAMWDVFQTNPGYRNNAQGLIFDANVRVQAWDLRNLAEAAFISPDKDSLKAEFNTLVANNLDYYNTTYTDNIGANKLGAITGPNSIDYNANLGVAPWMDDFFTSAIGHAAELGFTKAQPLLAWKAQFSTGRMTAPGYCWIFGGIYALNVRATTTSPIYGTFAEAYQASRPANVASLACASAAMAQALGLHVGEMTGYSSNSDGYPSNMQPALAYGADSGNAGAVTAWQVFMARSILPDYTANPEFAIVPRTVPATVGPLGK